MQCGYVKGYCKAIIRINFGKPLTEIDVELDFGNLNT